MKHEKHKKPHYGDISVVTSYDFWLIIHGSSLAKQVHTTTIDPDISDLTEVSLGKTEISLPQDLVKL